MQKNTQFITHTAFIATVYVVLTYASSLFGLSSGVIQVRFSEALTVLPVFTPAAIPGLCIGCFLSNLLTGCAFWDIIFGTFATLIGAIGTYFLRKKPYAAPIPPIISNMIIIPFILHLVYQLPGGIFFFMLTVGAGEIISCGVLGMILYTALKKTNIKF